MATATVVEIGAGAAQCSRWLARQGVRVVATDVSLGMLRRGQRLDAEAAARGDGQLAVPLLQCDGAKLPLAAGSVDVVFTAYGVVPFVADSAAVMREAARMLRPGGRFVFSTTHPVRWAMPDEPGEEGLRVTASYFDRTPYVEQDKTGRATYVEHHRTLGDRVRELVAAGLVVRDVVEPEWPPDNESTWGGWSRAARGAGPWYGDLRGGQAVTADSSTGSGTASTQRGLGVGGAALFGGTLAANVLAYGYFLVLSRYLSEADLGADRHDREPLAHR